MKEKHEEREEILEELAEQSEPIEIVTVIPVVETILPIGPPPSIREQLMSTMQPFPTYEDPTPVIELSASFLGQTGSETATEDSSEVSDEQPQLSQLIKQKIAKVNAEIESMEKE